MVIGDIIDALKKDMLCPQSSFACFRTWLKWGVGGGGLEMGEGVLNQRPIEVSRPSNYPDLVGILQILLKNTESWRKCNQNRKNPDFDICSDIFK